MANLGNIDTDDLLNELIRRAKEGKVNLTEKLWSTMEPNEYEIIELCDKNDIQLFDEDMRDAEIEQAKKEGAEEALYESGILKLAALLVFSSSSRDFVYARDELKFLFQKEYNLNHAILL